MAPFLAAPNTNFPREGSIVRIARHVVVQYRVVAVDSIPRTLDTGRLIAPRVSSPQARATMDDQESHGAPDQPHFPGRVPACQRISANQGDR